MDPTIPDKQPDSLGGSGGLLETPRLERSDCQMIERAIRNNWDIPQETKRKIVNRLSQVIDQTPEEKNLIAACRTLISADSVDVRREGNDLARGNLQLQVAQANTPAQAPVQVVNVHVSNIQDRLRELESVTSQGPVEPVHSNGDGRPSNGHPAQSPDPDVR